MKTFGLATLILSLYLSCVVTLSGQDGNALPAREAFEILESGGLIVVLPSYDKKLKAIDTLLESSTVKEHSKKNLRKRKDAALKLKRQHLELFAKEIEETYKIGRVFFAYDTILDRLHHGQHHGLFIDVQGNPLPDLSLESKAIIAFPGLSKEQGLDVYLFSDITGNPILSPFPKYVMRYHLFDRLIGVFQGRQPEQMAARRFVKALVKTKRKL